MAGPRHNWLYLVNGDNIVEVINGARTATYLQTIGIDGIEICSILDLAGCPTYQWAPYAVDSADATIVGAYDPCSWVALEFDDPALDPAPWYDENYPESADALGFMIEDWTGLDSSHLSRPATVRGGAGGGVVLSGLAAGGRVQKLNVILLARSEEAMMYLFDWLDSTLIGSCRACATDTLLFRRVCGDEVDPARGVGEQRRVGLVEGLKWESDVAGQGRCYLRRASFTMTAGDPCIYSPEFDAEESLDSYVADVPTCLADANLSALRVPCRPSCSELTVDCRTSITFEVSRVGFAAPIVHLYNGFDTQSIPTRILVYSDPFGVGTDAPNPCGLPLLGEVYVAPLPPYSHMVWDVVGRRILYRDVSTGDFVESSAFIGANDPPIPRFFSVPCGAAHVVMEPGDFCLVEDGLEYEWPKGDILFTDPHFPEMEITLGERLSCP